jgi:hypothetical protein
MYDSIRLSVIGTISRVLTSCSLCTSQPATLVYDLTCGLHLDGTFQELHGYCCARCGGQLLESMQEVSIVEQVRIILDGNPAGRSAARDRSTPSGVL